METERKESKVVQAVDEAKVRSMTAVTKKLVNRMNERKAKSAGSRFWQLLSNHFGLRKCLIASAVVHASLLPLIWAFSGSHPRKPLGMGGGGGGKFTLVSIVGSQGGGTPGAGLFPRPGPRLLEKASSPQTKTAQKAKFQTTKPPEPTKSEEKKTKPAPKKTPVDTQKAKDTTGKVLQTKAVSSSPKPTPTASSKLSQAPTPAIPSTSPNESKNLLSGSTGGGTGASGTGVGAGTGGMGGGTGSAEGGFGPGIGGAGSGLGIAGEGEVADFYLLAIKRKVAENWVAPSYISGSMDNEVMIYFRILSSGEIVDARVEKPSIDKALELSALRAVELASPLPPLPNDYKEDALGIHFVFQVHRNEMTPAGR